MKISSNVKAFIEENIDLIDTGRFTDIVDKIKENWFCYKEPEVKFELYHVLSVTGMVEDPVPKLVAFQDTAKQLEDMFQGLFPKQKTPLKLTVDIDVLTGWVYLVSNMHNARGPVKFTKMNQDGTYTKPNLWDFKQRLITAYKYYCKINNLEC